MGKLSKGSRKGKKAWRANISTDDVDDFFEKSTKDALAGAKDIPDLPSQSLFYVDKSDQPSKDIPIKRKIEKHREKVLHYESILQRNPYVKPVPSSTTKKKNKRKAKELLKETLESSENPKASDSAIEDLGIWDKQGQTNGRAKKRSAPTFIPAVEVEPSGCSFNPSFEAHQDSLAQAVADEMNKIYKKELEPEPVPLTVPGEILAEEDKLFLDADDGNEDDITEEDVELNGGELVTERRVNTKRVTRVEQNRRARRKQQLRAEAEAKKSGNINKEIDNLPDIMEEIAKEDEEKQKRHLRRVVVKQERLKSAPPRLGRHKFEPAPVQVLLTEEITGSLRKLKGCCTLVRDRYKSYEKRGILVPRAKKTRR